MKNRKTFTVLLFSIAFALSLIIVIPTLLIRHDLTLSNAFGYTGFTFFVLINFGVIIFAHKILSGKAHDIIFTLCSAIMISFFIAIVIFGIIVNKGDFDNFDIRGVFDRIFHWDLLFLGLQFSVFIAFSAVYLGFIDRDLWKFMR